MFSFWILLYCNTITNFFVSLTLSIYLRGFLWVYAQSLSWVQLFAAPWTVAHQAPLSMGFSGQEHWSGLPCPPPGDLPSPGVEPASLVSSALAGRFFTPAPPGKPIPREATSEFALSYLLCLHSRRLSNALFWDSFYFLFFWFFKIYFIDVWLIYSMEV